MTISDGLESADVQLAKKAPTKTAKGKEKKLSTKVLTECRHGEDVDEEHDYCFEKVLCSTNPAYPEYYHGLRSYNKCIKVLRDVIIIDAHDPAVQDLDNRNLQWQAVPRIINENQGRQVTLIISYLIPVNKNELEEGHAIIGSFRLRSDEAWIMDMSGANATPAHANPNENLTPKSVLQSKQH